MSSTQRSASRWNTLLTTASSSAVSWLITTRPPRKARRWSRSQDTESASRWLVGSSSSSVCDPPNRIRASSIAAALAAGQGPQLLPEHLRRQAQAGGERRRLGLGGVAAEHRQPLLEMAVPAHRGVAPGRVGVGHAQLGLAQVGQQRVQAAGRQHPVHGQAVEVADHRVLRQVPDRAAAADAARRRGRLARPAPGPAWSCPRRCGRPGRSCRRPRPGTWPPPAAAARPRATQDRSRRSLDNRSITTT